MEAAARGAKQAGGLTIGILPGSDPAAANPHIDVAIATGLGEMRNALIVRAAGAVIAIGGGWGTPAEIAFARPSETPVVGLHDAFTAGGGVFPPGPAGGGGGRGAGGGARPRGGLGAEERR